ncbi:MAG: right-handed parallel beta-helix repeat-containing protein [Flavobacteriales bacterium]
MRQVAFALIGLFIGISTIAQNNIYVSVFGDNSWNGITTATPVRDVQFAINISQPGDTINIYGGIYYEYLEVTHDQLTIRQASIWDEVIIEPSTGDIVENALLLIDGKFDITIDGIIFANHMYNYAQGIYVRGLSGEIAIRNCEVHDIHFSSDPNAAVNEDTNAQAIIIEGTDIVPTTGIEISNCEVYNCRLGYSEGIAINGNVNQFLIHNNHVHDLTNIGIVAIGHEGVGPNASADQASYGEIKGNHVHDCLSPYATSGGIYVDGATYISIDGNRCEHNGYGIEVGCEHAGKSASFVTVKNNIVSDNEVAGIALGGYDYPDNSGKIEYVEVRNNTFYKNDFLEDYTGEFFITYMENVEISNNIFYLNDQGVWGYAENQGPGIWVHNNVIYQANNTVELDWFGTFTESFLEIGSVLALNAGGVYGDPLFVSAEAGDFHIMDGSSAIGMAYQPTELQPGETDFYGEIRLVGLLDCGADEFGTSVSVGENPLPNEYSVYPNPANDAVLVDVPMRGDKMRLYDASGALVLDQQNLSAGVMRFELNTFENGMYFLHVGNRVHKLIIEH